MVEEEEWKKKGEGEMFHILRRVSRGSHRMQLNQEESNLRKKTGKRNWILLTIHNEGLRYYICNIYNECFLRYPFDD